MTFLGDHRRRSRDRPRELVRTALLWAAWALSLALALIAVLRSLDVVEPGAIGRLHRYTLWLYLPCYVVAAGAVLKRRWRLCALNATLAVVHLAWVLPAAPAAQGLPIDIDDGPYLRVLAANVSEANPTPAKLLGEIEREAADVVILLEYTPRWEATVAARDEFTAQYPYRHEVVREGASGIALFAKIPFTGVEAVDVEGWPIVRATVTLGEQPLRVYGVHAVAPGSDAGRHRRQHERIHELLAVEPDDQALVVAGDFAASAFDRTYGGYGDLGLDNAHEQRGRGLAWTYPNGAGWPRSWLKVRIDHVFVSEDLVAVRIQEGRGTGSDHRPVVADVAFRPRSLVERSR